MSDPWLISGRLALYLSLMLAFGLPVFVLQAIKGDGRTLPVARRLVLAAGCSSLLGLAASAFGLWAMARNMSGSDDPGAAWDVVRILLTQTAVGMAWDVRVLLLILASGLVFLPFRRPRAIAVALACLGGGALATLAWAGHGAMSEGAPGWLHLGSDIAHLLIAGAWVGAIAALALIAMSTAGQGDDATVRLLSDAANGFARFGTLIVIVLAISGIINYLFVVGPTLGGLVDSVYGRLLLAKLGVFAGMLALAAANRFRLAPALERALNGGDTASAVAALKRSLWVEMGAATLVLALVAWLGTLNPTE